MAKHTDIPKFSPLREKMHEVIFEADTKAGKLFDIILLVLILLSVLTVMLETVPSYAEYKQVFLALELIFTILFSIEYMSRIYCVYKPIKYATSFYGLVDLLSILPTFISFMLPGSQSLSVIRALRLMRVFRIFKMANFLNQGEALSTALKDSKTKITIFLTFVMILICVFGSVMYIVEGPVNDAFDSIPRSIYWAIVTMTTVGYGDISPVTPFGQFLSGIVMIIGYGVIAVPTGIVTSEIVNQSKNEHLSTQVCKYCSKEGHDEDAEFCKFCGEELNHDLT